MAPKTIYKEFLNKIDDLSAREKYIILGGAIFLISTIWWFLIFVPLDEEKQKTANQINSGQNQITRLQKSITTLATKTQESKLAEKEAQQEKLKTELNKLKSNLTDASKIVVPPRDMSGLLKDLLTKQAGIELEEIKTGEDQILAESKSGKKYLRKTLKLKFKGDYFSTINILKRLESLPWTVFYESISYSGYPVATIDLNIYVVGTEGGWLSV